MSDQDKQPKKRGRKPKKQTVMLSNNIIKKNSEEEPLIAHLDLKIEDLELSDVDDSSEIAEDNVFIKNLKEINNVNKDIYQNLDSENKLDISDQNDNSFQDFKNSVTDTINSKSTKEEKIEEIEKRIFNLKFELHKLTKNSNIKINKSNYTKETKCWWCKNSFSDESVSLPEYYFDGKFYCYGNFCSYNCAHSFNLDSNDNVWKKNSLLHLLYFKTYGENIKITPAPHWTSLEEFGGCINIEEFRKNSIVNTNEYLMLRPPMDSRLNFFEKAYKNDNSIFSNTMYQKLLDDSSDLVIKRSKPLKSSNYSLDKTLFIKKKERMTKMNETITSNI